jgi:tetratricopeptide (TPR) repeat protein
LKHQGFSGQALEQLHAALHIIEGHLASSDLPEFRFRQVATLIHIGRITYDRQSFGESLELARQASNLIVPMAESAPKDELAHQLMFDSHDLLGDVLSAIGRYDEAEEAWRLAIGAIEPFAGNALPDLEEVAKPHALSLLETGYRGALVGIPKQKHDG